MAELSIVLHPTKPRAKAHNQLLYRSMPWRYERVQYILHIEPAAWGWMPPSEELMYWAQKERRVDLELEILDA